MNTALKCWKEAATVILAAGVRRGTAAAGLETGPVHPTRSDPPHEHRFGFDYEVLLLKRSGKSGFMPNASVFPGGVVDSSDFSSDWLEAFKSFRHSQNFGLGFVRQPPETRPPVFATDRSKLGSPVPGDVAFRICAVRETFEESGVLLAVPKAEEGRILDTMNTGVEIPNPTPLTRVPDLCDTRELAKWRSLVIENPLNFVRMCKELDCLPNIWALYEWGNWLTPHGRRRYDTAFYICCLQDVPHTAQDQKEIVHFKWSSPPEILQSYQARTLWIAPPQFYDLSRLCRFPRLQDLQRFARERALEGCERWLPVQLLSPDCHISLLPGDGLYPKNLDPSGDSDVISRTEKSVEQLQQESESESLHRIVSWDLYSHTVHMSITPKFKHLRPVGGQVQACPSTPRSQL